MGYIRKLGVNQGIHVDKSDNTTIDLIVRGVSGPKSRREVDLEIRGVPGTEEMHLDKDTGFVEIVPGFGIALRYSQDPRYKLGNRIQLYARGTGAYSFQKRKYQPLK